jgi:hypothetical protein
MLFRGRVLLTNVYKTPLFRIHKLLAAELDKRSTVSTSAHHCVHKRPSLVPVSSSMTRILIATPSLSKPISLLQSDCPTKPVQASACAVLISIILYEVCGL